MGGGGGVDLIGSSMGGGGTAEALALLETL